MAAAARAALAAAEANAEAAGAPPNFPVQLAFAPNGAELAAHTLEGWCQLAPDDDIVSCDTRNMYNECRRAPSFEALREHDPECVPVYSMLYAHEADIYLDRTRDGAVVQLTIDQVCARAARLGVGGLEETEDPDAELERAFHGADDESSLPAIFTRVVRTACEATVATLITIALISTGGFHQGCALATNGSCIAYHVTLAREVQPRYPHARVLIYGDDTYGGDDGSRIYRWRDLKEEKCGRLGHVARHDKECCYSTRGDLAHAPASLPGSPRHPDGRLQGFKGVGCFYGNAEWVRQQLTLKMQRLYARAGMLGTAPSN